MLKHACHIVTLVSSEAMAVLRPRPWLQQGARGLGIGQPCTLMHFGGGSWRNDGEVGGRGWGVQGFMVSRLGRAAPCTCVIVCRSMCVHVCEGCAGSKASECACDLLEILCVHCHMLMCMLACFKVARVCKVQCEFTRATCMCCKRHCNC